MARWVFTDNVLATTYTMEMNPNSGGTPTFNKTLTSSTPSGPSGDAIVFEGQDEPRQFSAGGIVSTQAQLDALQTWYDKHYQVKVVDDLSRTFWIYIIELKFERAGRQRHQYRHTFKMSYVELDWA